MNVNAASRTQLSNKWLHVPRAIMSSAFAAFGMLPVKLCSAKVGDETSTMLADR